MGLSVSRQRWSQSIGQTGEKLLGLSQSIGCLPPAVLYALSQIDGHLEKPVNACNCFQQHQALQAKLKAVSSPAVIYEVEVQITRLQAQQQQLETDHQDYQQSLHALSQAIHPFDLKTGESQFGSELPPRVQVILSKKRAAESNLCPESRSSRFRVLACGRYQTYRSHFMLGGSGCFKHEAPKPKTLTHNTLVLTALLPWVYWYQLASENPSTPTQTGR